MTFTDTVQGGQTFRAPLTLSQKHEVVMLLSDLPCHCFIAGRVWTSGYSICVTSLSHTMKSGWMQNHWHIGCKHGMFPLSPSLMIIYLAVSFRVTEKAWLAWDLCSEFSGISKMRDCICNRFHHICATV